MVTGRLLKTPRQIDKQVNGLRDYGRSSNVAVYNAKTGKLKRIETPDGKVIRRKK